MKLFDPTKLYLQIRRVKKKKEEKGYILDGTLWHEQIRIRGVVPRTIKMRDLCGKKLSTILYILYMGHTHQDQRHRALSGMEFEVP